MRIETEKTKIEAAMQKASRVAGKHLTLPVLVCVCLEAIQDKLVIKSTNLDLGIEIIIKAKVNEPGVITVPANILLSVISSIKEEKLVLESLDNNLKITSDRNSVTIKSMPNEDFPSIPKIEGSEKTVSLNAKDFVLGLKSVWYSASNSTIKPELGSVFIHHEDNYLVFAATDSFRLAEKRVSTKIANDFPQILIPFRNVVEIIKFLENYNGEVRIIFEKNQAAFLIDGFYMVSRLIDGSFPDYKQIIPKTFESSVTLLKNDLLNSIKISNIFSDSLSQIKFSVKSKEKYFNIESKNNDIGEYKEDIKSEIVGGNIELSFNSRYVTDCLQSIPSESITLSFGGSGKPLLINGVSDKSFTYIVMPMNR